MRGLLAGLKCATSNHPSELFSSVGPGKNKKDILSNYCDEFARILIPLSVFLSNEGQSHLTFKDGSLRQTGDCLGQHSPAKLDLNTWIYISEKSEISTIHSVCSDGILKPQSKPWCSNTSNLSRFVRLLLPNSPRPLAGNGHGPFGTSAMQGAAKVVLPSLRPQELANPLM